MNIPLALILVVSLYLAGSAQAGVTTREADDFDVVAYLTQFDYLDDLGNKDHHQLVDRHHAPDSVKQAIREFQYMADIPVTGRLDSPTVKQMKMPRCGVPDVIKPSERPANMGNLNAPPKFQHLGSKWQKRDLTYGFKSFTEDMRNRKIRKKLKKALKKWADVTNLSFRQGKGKVDIEFQFVRGKHMDRFAFDGKGGTLAHAFSPGRSSLSGDVHFDDDEKFTVKPYAGTDLFQIAIHEIGHSLGLGHSRDRNAIMYAYYTGYKPDIELGADDIKGIQSLYGSRPVEPTGQPPAPSP